MHPINLPEPILSLDDVTDNFDHWRAVRKSKCKIPSELMEQAFSLVGHYPFTHICAALKFSNSGFKEKCTKRGLFDTKPAFIEVQTQQAHINAIQNDDIHIELKRMDGAQMIVHLPTSIAASQLINQFLKG